MVGAVDCKVVGIVVIIVGTVGKVGIVEDKVVGKVGIVDGKVVGLAEVGKVGNVLKFPGSGGIFVGIVEIGGKLVEAVIIGVRLPVIVGNVTVVNMVGRVDGIVGKVLKLDGKGGILVGIV